MSSVRPAAAAYRSGLRSLAAVLALTCMALAAPSGRATNYQVNPRVELAGGYDDNLNLGSSSNELAAVDGMADARVELLAKGPNWQWRATPVVRSTWYSGHSDYNSNGEFLYLDGARIGQR